MVDAYHLCHPLLDPGCPWAWSASPALSVLPWRYGDDLAWRHVMIGLSESGESYARRGYTADRMAQSYRRFRHRGMPFATAPRERMHGTWPMCRVSWRRACRTPSANGRCSAPSSSPSSPHALPRGLEDLRTAIALRPGHRPRRVIAAAGAATEEAFARPRRGAPAASGADPLHGPVAPSPKAEIRYTAPSLVFTPGGRRLEAGGFQPVEVYDALIANLDPTLERRGAAGTPGGGAAGVPGRAHDRRGRGVMPKQRRARPRSGRGRADPASGGGAGRSRSATTRCGCPSAPVALAQAA